jgi:hypothetical protein
MKKKSKKRAKQNETSPLEHIFGSKTRVRILNLFFANPTKSFYLREISKRIGIRLHSVRREIGNLRQYNVILEENCRISDKKTKSPGGASSYKKYFIINTESFIYPELKALLLKGHLFLENDLVKAIGKLGSVSLVLLGGMFVDERETPADLLIVGKLSNGRLARLINNFEKKLGFEIKYTLMPKSEYQYRKLIADKFLCSILDGKHIVALNKMPKEK